MQIKWREEEAIFVQDTVFFIINMVYLKMTIYNKKDKFFRGGLEKETQMKRI